MTKKRFRKLAMARGMSRNCTEIEAEICLICGITYERGTELVGKYGAVGVWPMDEEEPG